MPEKYNDWLDYLVFLVCFAAIYVILMTVVGCNAAPVGIDTTAQAIAALKAQVNNLQTSIGTIRTTIGGDGDSIALWLSIVSGPACLLGYMGIVRPLRANALAKRGVIDRRQVRQSQ